MGTIMDLCRYFSSLYFKIFVHVFIHFEVKGSS